MYLAARNTDSAKVHTVAFDDKHLEAVKEIRKEHFESFGSYIVPRN